MPAPFDEVIEAIRVAGYHNQRLEEHSDLVSNGIFRDLRARCPLIDLGEVLGAIHRTKAEAIIAATVLVGTATRVLNVPDHVKKRYQKEPRRFEAEVVPRLSRGDETLWTDFDYAVSVNRPDDPARTIAAFHTLPRRHPGHTHM